jgi:hypothetical protein
MKTLEIKINIDNSAYDYECEQDILIQVMHDIEKSIQKRSSIIKDINGNTVGEIKNNQEETISIPVSLYQAVRYAFNMIPNKKMSGHIGYRDTYEIVSSLEKFGGRI